MSSQLEESSQPVSTAAPSPSKLAKCRSCCKKKALALAGECDLTPAPAAYYVKTGGVGEAAAHGAGITILGRHKKPIPDTPGPTEHVPPCLFGNLSPKWSIATRKPEKVSDVPGPTGYSPNWRAACARANGPAFTVRARVGRPLFFSTESTPSPNEYRAKLPRSLIEVSLKGRMAESKPELTPGPGSYILRVEPSTPKYTIVARNPGPEDLVDTACGLESFGELRRCKSSKFRKSNNSSSFAPENGNKNMCTDNFSDDDRDGARPGPAAYRVNHMSTIARAPSYTLSPRAPPLKTGVVSPGPAYAYGVNTIAQNTAPKISLKPRRPEKQDPNPGPADYNPRVTSSRAVKEKQDRPVSVLCTHSNEDKLQLKQQLQQRQRQPGPADYHPEPALAHMWRSAPKYTLGFRSQNIVDVSGHDQTTRKKSISTSVSRPGSKITTPAPNAYNVRLPQSGRAATLKGRLSDAVLIFPTQRQNTLRLLD